MINNKKYYVNGIKKIFYIFFKAAEFIKYAIISEKPLCRIEEINLAEQTIIIHCRNIGAPIKLTLDEVINDPAILENLSPKQASWIGYYYGKYYKTIMDAKDERRNVNSFSINESLGNYNIVMLNRYGNLIYSSRADNITRIISPIDAIICENIIMKFPPMQACYIGILAGTFDLKKYSQKISPSQSKAQLKVIK